MSDSETENVKERYARRSVNVEIDRYSFLKPAVWQSVHERQRAIIALFIRLGYSRLDELKLVEIGCGGGENLLDFLRMGFKPKNLRGLELLEERVALANSVLPTGIVIAGDASTADISVGSQDIVYQSGVFSSLLDNDFQNKLAARMWSWVRPGGGVLWYDFVYDNPSNPDVRGVRRARVRELFPDATFEVQRLTLAPPIGRFVSRVYPGLYGVFNMVPLLRTHILCWLSKPAK